MAEYDVNNFYPWIKAYVAENGVFGVMIYEKNGKQGEFTPIGENIPWHPYADTLGVFYVHNNGDIFELVRNDMLPDGMTENALYETACQNLLRDMMITAAENDKKQIKGLKKAIKNIMKNGEFPLSTAIFKWENKNGD